MKLFLTLILVVVFILLVVNGAKDADKIEKLPGFNGELPTSHYSGYLPVGQLSGTRGQLHYWFIESTKGKDAPLALWLNGGPGSSSLIGLLTELGQISTNDMSLTDPIDGVPQVFLNDYAWTNEANIIFLESPKGVGFSYCEDATTSADCVNTDESTAQDAYEALVQFFISFPEYKTNKFYVTGESYAGIYIPMLLDQLDKDVLGAKINLIGAAIGNGCWGNTVGTCAFSSPEALQIKADFFYGHGMYSQTLKEEIDLACGDFNSLRPKCIQALDKMNEQIGNFNVYNIYDNCGVDQRRKLDAASYNKMLSIMSDSYVTVETSDSFKITAGYGEALNDYYCGAENAMDAYLSNEKVIEALHVKSNTVGMQYKKTVGDLRPLYSSLIQKYQILIYSGEADGCVPYVGTEAWTRGLNYTVVDDWHQWTAQPKFDEGVHKAGYAINYDKFSFVTVQGAGHMVPQFQPGYALGMIQKFFNNEKF